MITGQEQQQPLQLAEQFFAEYMDPKRLILIANKCDLTATLAHIDDLQDYQRVVLSTKNKIRALSNW